MRYITFIVFLPLIWLAFFQDPRLKGTYKMVYNKKYGETSRSIMLISTISFKDNTYYRKVKNEIIDSGKINNQDSGNRTIAYLIISNAYHPVNSIDSVLHKSFGTIIIELKGITEDSIKFRTTYSTNLHITVDNGTLVKIK